MPGERHWQKEILDSFCPYHIQILFKKIRNPPLLEASISIYLLNESEGLNFPPSTKSHYPFIFG